MKARQNAVMESLSRFENLPTEVLLHILTHILDMHCLWPLLTASPASYRVFNQYSQEIFWPSISDSKIPSQTQEIIRFVLLLRAGAFSKTNLDDVARKIKDREAGIVLGESKELGYDFETMDSTKTPSLSVQRSVLSVAGHVHRLSRSCINYYLGQLKMARDEGRLEWGGCVDDGEMVPSWTEEQRMIRAFWRIQLINELKMATQSLRIIASSRKDDAEVLDIERFYDSSTSNLKAAYHEVMTALEYLGQLARSDTFPSQGRLPPCAWPESGLKPSTLGMPSTDSMRRSALVLPTDGLWIVDSMSRGAHSPIKYAGFEPYRALGFAIWDRHRLADMGLASPPGQGRVTGLGSYFLYWVKLLGSGDLSRAEGVMKSVETRGGRLGPLQPMIQDNDS